MFIFVSVYCGYTTTTFNVRYFRTQAGQTLSRWCHTSQPLVHKSTSTKLNLPSTGTPGSPPPQPPPSHHPTSPNRPSVAGKEHKNPALAH